MNDLIAPHGGVVRERLAKGREREELLKEAQQLPSVTVDEWTLSDIELFAIGAISPLEGFLRQADYDSVVDRMRLVDGTVWSLPITLALMEEEADQWREGTDLVLKDPEGRPAAVLHQPELYPYNKSVEAKLVYGTTDASHPGVARLMAQGPYYIGGALTVLDVPRHNDFLEHRLTPSQTREEFRRRGWRQVVGFQTRNPIHRAHEYLLRCGLEIADGLMIHPLVGQTKGDDIPADIRMRCYKALIEGYHPKDRVLLVVNPAPMRYGGPREAIFHAIIRQNYGCTHFIVGRDHAGVGNYYGTFDAHLIFDNFTADEIGITPLFFDHSFYCKKCEEMASNKTCPHTPEDRVALSGTKVRELLQAGQLPPLEFSRPEVAKILIESMRK